MTGLRWLGITLGAFLLMGCGKQKTAESAGARDADVAIVTGCAFRTSVAGRTRLGGCDRRLPW